jgi:cytochrome c553
MPASHSFEHLTKSRRNTRKVGHRRGLRLKLDVPPAGHIADRNDQLASAASGLGGCVSCIENDAHGCKDDTYSEFSDLSHSDIEAELPACRRYVHQKLVVVHNYHDHLNDPQQEMQINHSKNQIPERDSGSHPPFKKTSIDSAPNDHLSFPEKLHYMLHRMEKEGLQHVVCWKPHGRSFAVGDKKEFLENIVPRYGLFQHRINRALCGWEKLQ